MRMQQESPVIYHYFWHVIIGTFGAVSLVKFYSNFDIFDGLRVIWLIWAVSCTVVVIVLFVFCPRKVEANE